MILLLLEWLATALGIVGAVLVGARRVEGWYCWFVGNLLWCALGIRWRKWGLVALNGVYWIIAVSSIYAWHGVFR